MSLIQVMCCILVLKIDKTCCLLMQGTDFNQFQEMG